MPKRRGEARASRRIVARLRRAPAAIAAVAAVALLATPSLASAAANPLSFDYSNSSAILDYAHPTGAVVVGRNFTDTATIDRVQAGGGEVYMYVNVVDGFWDGMTATGEQAALYGGSTNDPSYLWQPRRYNWPGTPMLDLRPGSPWVLHAVDHLARWFPTTHAKGIFLDVVGDRLWSGAWDQMSASERSAWAAGNADFVHRLRAALGPNVILVANNFWNNGNPDLNGITLEHHPFSEVTSLGRQVGRSDWAKPVRNMVIATSVSDARQWAGVPGVTHISAQSTYDGPAAPIMPFSQLPSLFGPVTPAPPPSTGTPAPPAPTGRSRAPRATAPPSPGAIAPSAPKLLPNGSFELGTMRWRPHRAQVRSVVVAGAPKGSRVARVTFTGGGGDFSVGGAAARQRTPAAGTRFTATAVVRAGRTRSVGKPVRLILRERTARGRIVQQVRGAISGLGPAFTPVTAGITAKAKGSQIDVLVVQKRATRGDAFLLDAVSLTQG